jgi:hypothetical protein
VGGEAVTFAVALFGLDAAVLAPTAARLLDMPWCYAAVAAPLLADADLANAAELAGKVAGVRRCGDGVPFHARARRAQQTGAVAVVCIHNEGDAPVVYADGGGKAADIAIPALCVGRANGERLLLGGAAVVTFGYDEPAEVASGRPQAAAQAKRVARAAGGGIAISGLPDNLVFFNATYAPTGALVDGYPAYSAGPDMHLFRHPRDDEWFLHTEPFDPAVSVCLASILAAGGPVPTGTRAWTVHTGGNVFVEHEVTAREVA